jgi:hypothetical protein
MAVNDPFMANDMKSGVSRLASVGLAAAALLLIGGLTWHRWHDPGANGPLNCDELVSLEYYTSAGLLPSGDPRPLRRIEDYRNLPAPSLKQFVMGVYRSLGAWIDTGNHIPNSFLMNIAVLGGAPSEARLRLPAFAAALAFAIAMYCFLQFVVRWHYSAPLAALWAFSLPYVIRYGSEARGYSISLLLQVLFLAFACQAARRPAAVRWGAAQAAVAILAFANLVNQAADWLLPAYAALWFFPPESTATPMDRAQKRQWRQNLAIQILAIGAVGFVFLCDRLPYVMVKATQYGIPFSTPSDLLAKSQEFANFLFPGPEWIVLACAGLAGIAMLGTAKKGRWLGIVFAATILVNLAHFCLVKKLTYPRTCGFFLPPLLIGAAYLVERLIARRDIWPRMAAWTAAAAFTGVLVWQSANFRLEYNFDYPSALGKLDAESVSGSSSTVYCVGPSADYCMDKYLPASWLSSRDDITCDTPIRQAVFYLSSATENPLNTGAATDTLPPHARGNFHGTGAALDDLTSSSGYDSLPLGRFRLLRCDVRVEPFTSAREYPGKAPILIIWYPDPMRVGCSDDSLTDALAPSGVPYFPRARIFPARLNIFSRAYAVEIFVNSESRWEKAKDAVRREMDRFGGRAVVLVAKN